MDRDRAQALLARVAAGEVAPADALDALVMAPYDDLGHSRADTTRALRTGDPEVVYGAGKTTAQVLDVVAALAGDRAVLITRAAPDAVEALRARHPDAVVEGATVAVGPLPEPRGTVVVAAAGTSDGPVAAEAALTARVHGAAVERVDDVGVAGLHRLLAVRAVLDRADCLVVVAGMEGALPSVVGGLVGTPLVAVPTSVGYGASYGGLAALLAMLNSCAPGVVVVNVDNGFGAGVHAARVARRAARP
ncbi:MAG TPA: nickel pincer cofactor biosynthesis protein LarB [Mycobacteriales bacterium]|jgi:hypothetical protein|nr:nickel pincer cofactor biosynthesis protein LarB [Mycobacteriales bacterium]